jgi:predicted esterase
MGRGVGIAGAVFAGWLLAALPARAAAPGVQQENFGVGDVTIARITLAQGNARPVRYFLSMPAQRAPLVLTIQGSGCTPPFAGLGTPTPMSTIYNWLPLAGGKRYAMMAVEKPYQPDEPQRGKPGSAEGCAGGFNQHFSYGIWLNTLARAVRDALTRPEVDPHRVLVIGTSEGATMAAGLARALPEITDVVLIGASGPTQLYDFAANIHRTDDSDADKLRRLQELDATVSAIEAEPRSADKFAWGHPYLRWSTFFAQSTLDNLSRSNARVYLASGMQDESVPIQSTEALYAQLRAQGRDVTFRRVPGAGHNLAPDGRPITDAQKEYDAFMAWFERR